MCKSYPMQGRLSRIIWPQVVWGGGKLNREQWGRLGPTLSKMGSPVAMDCPWYPTMARIGSKKSPQTPNYWRQAARQCCRWLYDHWHRPARNGWWYLSEQFIPSKSGFFKLVRTGKDLSSLLTKDKSGCRVKRLVLKIAPKRIMPWWCKGVWGIISSNHRTISLTRIELLYRGRLDPWRLMLKWVQGLPRVLFHEQTYKGNKRKAKGEKWKLIVKL